MTPDIDNMHLYNHLTHHNRWSIDDTFLPFPYITVLASLILTFRKKKKKILNRKGDPIDMLT